MPRRKAKSNHSLTKQRDRFGSFFKKSESPSPEDTAVPEVSDDDEEEEVVDGDTNFQIVCDVDCDCSQENVFGINVDTDIEILCGACDTAILSEEKRWRTRGFNSNVKGAGTSRSTFFDKEKKRKLTKDAARNHSQPIQNFFSKTNDLKRSRGDVVSDNDDFDVDERPLYQILFDGDIESDNPKSTKKQRFNIMHSVLTGIAAISHVDQHGKSLTGNSKDGGFEKSNAFFDRLVAKAIHSYLILLNAGMSKMVASRQVAGHLFEQQEAMLNNKDSYRAQCIRQWARDYLCNEQLPEFHQGQHIKTTTVITQEGVKAQFTAYLRQLSDFDRTPERFMQELNSNLLKTIPNAPNSVCLKTAKTWMHYLGFHPTRLTKGYFTDDHNRPDVTQYRDDVFLKIMADYEKLMAIYIVNNEGETVEQLPVLKEGEKRIVMITHDESTFYSNECKQMVWMENG